MKTVQELMNTTVQTCNLNTTIDQACDLMRSNGLHTLVVIDNHSKVQGTLSYLDACLASLRLDKLVNDISVSEAMSKNSYTVHLHDDERLALNLMRRFHMNKLVVVDQENKLKGSVHFMTLARRVVLFKRKFSNLEYASSQMELI